MVNIFVSDLVIQSSRRGVTIFRAPSRLVTSVTEVNYSRVSTCIVTIRSSGLDSCTNIITITRTRTSYSPCNYGCDTLGVRLGAYGISIVALQFITRNFCNEIRVNKLLFFLIYLNFVQTVVFPVKCILFSVKKF